MFRVLLIGALCIVGLEAGKKGNQQADELPPYPSPYAALRGATTGTYHEMELDATQSKGQIKTYTWEMIKGDKVGKKIKSALGKYSTNNPGQYKWKLTVCDVFKRCMSTVADIKFKTVKPPRPNKNRAPVIVAEASYATTGSNHEMHVDASESFDDDNIESFTWTLTTGVRKPTVVDTREGPVLNFSTNEGGLYKWKLTVCDVFNKCSSKLFKRRFKTIKPVYD